MKRWKKWLVFISAAIIFSIGLLYLAAWLIFGRNSVPSNIVDFRPSSFEATADRGFFYSVGNDLKYSDRIDTHAPTLLHGKIREFLVAPDEKTVAVVANGKLVVVGSKSTLGKVAAVDSIYREPKPIGHTFFRDENFQWSEDSKYLYLIRDTYYNSNGSQLFSEKGELWKYDLESGGLQVVLKPFPAFSYFLVGSRIFFSVPTPRGDLQLKCFDGHTVTDVGQPNEKDIDIQKSAKNYAEPLFYSFSTVDYERALARSKKVTLHTNTEYTLAKLMIENKPYLTITKGATFKGPYYCGDLLRSAFLPGERFFLLDADNCGNFSGQLLIDTLTGKYEQLPPDSVVYVTLNTVTHPHYDVTAEGVSID